MRKSCAVVPALWKLNVTVPGFGIDVLERWNENSLPETEIVVAAAWAVGPVRAEASPTGVSAAMAAAATMSLFMVCSLGVVRRASVRAGRASVVGVQAALRAAPWGVRPPPAEAARHPSERPRA